MNFSMNKKKRIKKLVERVAQLERARSIHNEYWQTHIVGLEQRIDLLEARRNIWCWPPQKCWMAGGTSNITVTWPTTTDANIAGS